MSGPMKSGEKIKTLKRRRDFLSARIATYRADGNSSRDRAECASLSWAIAVIEEAKRRDLLDELTRVKVTAA